MKPTTIGAALLGETTLAWLMRVAWATLPLSTGALVDDIAGDWSSAARWTAALLAWGLWVAALVGLLVRRPWGLTALRLAAPLPVVVAIVGAAGSDGSWIAAAHGAAVLVLALLPEVGAHVVDGLSYGDERRLILRVPFALVAGPIPLVWALVVAGVVSGPFVLAAGGRVLGALLVVIGFPIAWMGVRSLHQLSRRWIVFVPNGFVVHDLLATREPFLLRRQDVLAIGPAAIDIDLSDETLIDLSSNALGVVLDVQLDGDIEVVPVSRRVAEVKVVQRVLVTPSRPGAVLREARARRIPK